MILFVQNLCSATREVLKCTMRYSSSFEDDDLLGLIRLGFRSPLDMLPGGLLSGGASRRRPIRARRYLQRVQRNNRWVIYKFFNVACCTASGLVTVRVNRTLADLTLARGGPTLGSSLAVINALYCTGKTLNCIDGTLGYMKRKATRRANAMHPAAGR